MLCLYLTPIANLPIRFCSDNVRHITDTSKSQRIIACQSTKLEMCCRALRVRVGASRLKAWVQTHLCLSSTLPHRPCSLDHVHGYVWRNAPVQWSTVLVKSFRQGMESSLGFLNSSTLISKGCTSPGLLSIGKCLWDSPETYIQGMLEVFRTTLDGGRFLRKSPEKSVRHSGNLRNYI